LMTFCGSSLDILLGLQLECLPVEARLIFFLDYPLNVFLWKLA